MLSNLACGSVAQLVERWLETPEVGGSTPPLATIVSALDSARAVDYHWAMGSTAKREIRRSKWSTLVGYRACRVYFDDGTSTTLYEHREVMEKTLGRPIRPGYVVHHIDRDRSNNDPANLVELSASDHAAEHYEDRLAASPVAEHGSERRYVDHGCRCNTCRKGNADRNREYRARRELRDPNWRSSSERKRGPYKPAEHGSHVMYSYHKCRCDICREGHKQLARARAARLKADSGR